MKIQSMCSRLCLFAFAAFCLPLNAQTVSDDFKNTMNSVFAGMDLNKVPHHLLLDYALEFVDIRSYKGVATDTNYVHKGIYTAGYNTLLMARTKTTVPDLVHPDIFESNWKAARTPYTIALSGFYYKYARLRQDSNPELITVSRNKLYDKYVNGVWRNPYETDEVFMMTAPIMYYRYKNMNVKMPSNLWYTNQDAQVQSVAVNFNDGNGYQNVSADQTIYVNYKRKGTYTWDYRVTLTNGQKLYSHSKLIVGNLIAPLGAPAKRLPDEPCNAGTLVNGFDQVEFQGTTNFAGSANSATIQIDYIGANACGDITRPLIVAEGFESGLLGGEDPLGDNNIKKFIFETNNQTGNLSTEIANYDIIYINWDQGRDDLRRNAALLQDIIEWVNTSKTTDSTNVVLGQSMGGIIARYTLAQMEQDPDLDHDTHLYISHDAPHQGANIPISVQYLARHMADEFVSTPVGELDLPTMGGGSVTIDDINNVFNSIGTQQLLANTIDGGFNLNNGAFDAWQTELQNVGYPQQTRNISISNGSHCSNIQENGPLGEVVYVSGNIEPTIFLDILINQIPILSTLEDIGYVTLAIILEDPAYLAGLLPGRTNLNARFEGKNLPPVGQIANIYRGRIRITKKIDFFIGSLTYNINVTDRNYNNPNEVQLPLDSYPGGEYPVTFRLDSLNQSETNNWLYNLDITGRNASGFNFIPSTSALDVGSGSVNLNNTDYLRIYTAANPPTGNHTIPFHNFITAYENANSINEAHISFNMRNGDWLATELDTNPNNQDVFDCSFICNDTSLEITGSNILCDTETYSLNIAGVEYDWDIIEGGDLATITNNGNQTITLTSNSPFSYGDLVLEVTFGNDRCGDRTEFIDIRVGDNEDVGITGLENGMDAGSSLRVELTNTNGCGEIYFVDSGGADVVYYGDDFVYLSTPSTASGTGYIYISLYGANSIYQEFQIHNNTPPPIDPPSTNGISVAQLPNTYPLAPINSWTMIKATHANSTSVDYWQWSYNDVHYAFPADDSVIYLPPEVGNVYVSVRACNSGGCSNYVSFLVH
ncbi:hypothetical protein [Winogradskyella wichelsiae]|uniref:hypothetical protein n=1 Tax=Winogradskyella wichelsiae TaxID=2697007 RepID=UPI003EF4A656